MNERVHVDREAVADATDLDVLIERVVVAILGQEANVALAVGHLVLAGSVIGHISVRDVLDVTDHAVEHLGHLHIGVVIHGDDLGTGAVLTLVVGDLTYVLGQLVDCERGAGVDGLTLHRTTGCQHIGGPLPVVIG